MFVSHDTEFVEQLRPTKVLLMPDGAGRLLQQRLARARQPGLTCAVASAHELLTRARVDHYSGRRFARLNAAYITPTRGNAGCPA